MHVKIPKIFNIAMPCLLCENIKQDKRMTSDYKVHKISYIC